MIFPCVLICIYCVMSEFMHLCFANQVCAFFFCECLITFAQFLRGFSFVFMYMMSVLKWTFFRRMTNNPG